MTTPSGADRALACNPVELACFADRVCLRAMRAQANRPIVRKKDQRTAGFSARCKRERNIIDWPSPLEFSITRTIEH
jgi:hypothetical protein